MTTKRIYLVHHSAGGSIETHLVDAPNQAQAIAHVVRGKMTCRVASQSDLVVWIAKGLRVEDCDAPKEPTQGGSNG